MSKESFIVYTSFYKPISKLSDKQLGRLFRAIFNYHIDGVVAVEEDIEMAFAFFVNQFEIDESKYQSKVERNRESGRKGGISRANRDADKNSTDNSERLKPKPTLEQSSESSERLKPKQTLKNQAYNDNDNDNELSSTTTRPRAHEREGASNYEEFLDNFFADQISVEVFCMNNHISVQDFRRLAEETITEWKLTGQKHDNDQDARRHLLNQARIKINRISNDTKPQDRYTKRRGADSAARSPEDYTGEI